MVLGAAARVGACMQMAACAAGKEWRGHVEQTKKHEEAIQAALPVTTTQLALIGTEVSMQDTRMYCMLTVSPTCSHPSLQNECYVGHSYFYLLNWAHLETSLEGKCLQWCLGSCFESTRLIEVTARLVDPVKNGQRTNSTKDGV